MATWGLGVTIAPNATTRLRFGPFVRRRRRFRYLRVLQSGALAAAGGSIGLQVFVFAANPPDTEAGFAAGSSLFGLGTVSMPSTLTEWVVPLDLTVVEWKQFWLGVQFTESAGLTHVGAVFLDYRPLEAEYLRELKELGLCCGGG